METVAPLLLATQAILAEVLRADPDQAQQILANAGNRVNARALGKGESSCPINAALPRSTERMEMEALIGSVTARH